MNLRTYWITCLAMLFFSANINLSKAQSFDSKKENPFKNPNTVIGKLESPAFNGWNVGVNYSGFGVRLAYEWQINQGSGHYLMQKVMYIPEIHLGYRTGKRIFAGVDFLLGSSSMQASADVKEKNEEMHVKFNALSFGYTGYVGFGLEPYVRGRKQKNAIVFSLYARLFRDLPEITITDRQTGNKFQVYSPYDPSAVGLQLMYERVIVSLLHCRMGASYTIPGIFDLYPEAEGLIGFNMGIIRQF